MVLRGSSSEQSPYSVRLIDVHGIEGTINRTKRLVKKMIMITLASGVVSTLGANEARMYTRGVTGFDSRIFEELKRDREAHLRGEVQQEEGMLTKAYQWIQGTQSIQSIAEATATYKEMRYQYYSILSLLDDTSYWGAFIVTFYAMTKMLLALDRYRRKGKEGIDPDMKTNQDRLAAAINRIGQHVHALEQGAVSKEEMKMLVDTIQQVQDAVEVLESKIE